ncbi:PEP/pyruvate-binding domain-containing protein [Granulicoccus phenolivorans]|uniref:PEP/pyruvate-binding domain-containing protein n=1 Tax=Granulicoccus phenolivorans TaxID=266854 RepID=UPI0004174B68|nr:PEP/pyruvate-binding domain-containing protein [Granulicoccus phenolivorans]
MTGADHGSGRATHASTGIAGLDEVVNELRLGDNVVWQVDGIDSYRALIAPFVRRALAEDREVVYFRFGEHPMLLADDLLAQVTVHRVDPSGGFEAFATRIHWLIADRPQTFYVFDCLSELLTWWHSALMVTNFFKVTCPLLFEMDTVAYFALLRGKHANEAVAGIRETTQLLLDVYTIAGALYVHPLKVVGRHSATMFFPHRLTDGKAETVTSSEALARLFAVLAQPGPPADHWRSVVDQCWAALREGPTEQIHARDLLMGVLIGREGPMRELCERHLNLLDLLLITSRLIGVGAIGGKSVGMLVARAILEKDLRFAGRLEGHDSFFLGSDLFYSYIVTNGWWPLWAQHKTQEGYYSAAEQLRELLPTGHFPMWAQEQFTQLLEHFGQSPIIVRSSSLLEDNFGNAFAGKYESVFCANQGTPEDRYAAFEDAVRDVFASAVSLEALEYRVNRGLVELDEQMSVLVQRVSGDHHGSLFFPHAAGVGNSYNLYVTDAEGDGDAGMLRLVLGLGTRAVDRILTDYARIVALDRPTFWNATADDGARYSQRLVDVLNLADNRLDTVELRELQRLDIGMDWSLVLSPDQATVRLLRERGRPVSQAPQVVDFDGLLRETDFAALLRDILRVLEAEYAYPVDIEFTVNYPSGVRSGDGFKVSLVQCRPLQTRGLGRTVEVPEADPRRCLFASHGNFMGGNAQLPLDYVVLVRPEAYLLLGQQDRYAVARQIGRLNKILKDRSTLLMGPGRWGTTTPSLGVPVGFADICHATVLTELTYPEGDFRPELSYGSHFFADLVESGIFYVALDDLDHTEFHSELITGQPNLLTELDPDATLGDVIHVARLAGLNLYADVVSQRLVCQ